MMWPGCGRRRGGRPGPTQGAEAGVPGRAGVSGRASGRGRPPEPATRDSTQADAGPGPGAAGGGSSSLKLPSLRLAATRDS